MHRTGSALLAAALLSSPALGAAETDLSLGDVLRRMPLHRGAAMLASYAAARLRVAAGGTVDDSFESWVVNRFGRALYDVYFGPYTAKLWGMDPKDLSPDWASQRISVPDLWGLVKETVSPGEDKARSLVSLFSYPRGGIGRIADALAARVRAARAHTRVLRMSTHSPVIGAIHLPRLPGGPGDWSPGAGGGRPDTAPFVFQGAVPGQSSILGQSESE